MMQISQKTPQIISSQQIMRQQQGFTKMQQQQKQVQLSAENKQLKMMIPPKLQQNRNQQPLTVCFVFFFQYLGTYDALNFIFSFIALFNRLLKSTTKAKLLKLLLSLKLVCFKYVFAYFYCKFLSFLSY